MPQVSVLVALVNLVWRMKDLDNVAKEESGRQDVFRLLVMLLGMDVVFDGAVKKVKLKRSTSLHSAVLMNMHVDSFVSVSSNVYGNNKSLNYGSKWENEREPKLKLKFKESCVVAMRYGGKCDRRCSGQESSREAKTEEIKLIKKKLITTRRKAPFLVANDRFINPSSLSDKPVLCTYNNEAIVARGSRGQSELQCELVNYYRVDELCRHKRCLKRIGSKFLIHERETELISQPVFLTPISANRKSKPKAGYERNKLRQ